MRAGDWIAVASAAVAGVGALTAIWQARHARRAAAEAKDLADKPEFVIASAAIEDDLDGQPEAQITVEQVGVGALARVEITARGQYVRCLTGYDSKSGMIT